jgi:hypothetical protein
MFVYFLSSDIKQVPSPMRLPFAPSAASWRVLCCRRWVATWNSELSTTIRRCGAELWSARCICVLHIWGRGEKVVGLLSDDNIVEYHALGLLHYTKKAERLVWRAVCGLLGTWTVLPSTKYQAPAATWWAMWTAWTGWNEELLVNPLKFEPKLKNLTS